jgi:hypothetical protein
MSWYVIVMWSAEGPKTPRELARSLDDWINGGNPIPSEFVRAQVPDDLFNPSGLDAAEVIEVQFSIPLGDEKQARSLADELSRRGLMVRSAAGPNNRAPTW